MTSSRLRENAATVAHLVVIGLAGTAALTVFLIAVTLGILLIPVAGLGFFVLAFAAWMLAAIARFEDERVAGLFGYPTARRSFVPLRATSVRGWFTALWQRFADARDWLGFAHLAIITVLGAAVVWLGEVMLTAIAAALAALTGASSTSRIPWSSLTLDVWAAVAVDAGIVTLCLAGVFGLASAHRGVSRMLIPSRTTELEAAAATATARRDDAVQAAHVERTRIERDLHDGVQPRLVSIGMTLGMAKTKIAQDPTAAAALIDEAHASTKEAITELRHLARGFRPAVLEDRGLDAALSALAARSPLPVTLDVRVDGRCSETAESAMYFAVAECLTNAAKHSGAATCRVTLLSRPGGMLWARIEDDGRGGARVLPGGGLDGLVRRVQAAGGTVSVTSPEGGPTTIEVSLPCAS